MTENNDLTNISININETTSQFNNDNAETKVYSEHKPKHNTEEKLEQKHNIEMETKGSAKIFQSDDSWLNNINETTSIDELIKQSDKMIGMSMALSNPYITSIQLEIYKEQLVKYLQTKIDKLNQRIRLVQHKYASYKYYNNGVNIGIILLSTTMTILESIKSQINEQTLRNDVTLRTSFNLFPILIASSITCAAAIVKFKKFQEKMEGITKTVEKCVFSISRIKKCQEDIIFLQTQEEFDDVKNRYHKDIYEYYSTCDQEIQLFLKTDDYGKYLKTLNDMDLHVMMLEKNKLKRERYIESEFHSYMEELNKVGSNNKNRNNFFNLKNSNCVIL
tara:strand:- start:463 stop:1464 length:1002 start_codon:yes stop_codon:yes gene_type:complete